LEQAGCRVGVIGSQLAGQTPGGVEALGWIGVVERSGQTPVDRAGQLPANGSPARFAASSGSATLTTGTFFFTVVPFL
jgi:hypothetical protein